MRDAAILAALLGLAAAAFHRAWLGVVGLAVVGFLHPQGYATGFLAGAPVYQAGFLVVCAAAVKALVVDKWRPVLFWDWRLAAIGLLWAWFALTTWQAINPWAAWLKLWDVAKILPPLILLLLLIDTREKLAALIAAIGLSIALAAIKGGYWAIMTGFNDRVYGPPGSPYAGNNEFAVAVVMAIPLLVLWRRASADAGLRRVLVAVIALCYVAVLTSWSRGGLLSLGVVTALLALQSRRRWLALAAIAGGAALVAASFPEAWFGRMQTIAAFQGEGSAQARLEIWRIGLDFVAAHPLLGGGFDGWVFASLPTGTHRDWHNAYIELAAEHGLIGLGLWAALVLGSIASLIATARRARRSAIAWPADYAAMLGASLAGYLAGAAFLGIAYWELLYWLLAASMLVRRCAEREGEPPPRQV